MTNNFYHVAPIANRQLVEIHGLIAALAADDTPVDQPIGSKESAVTLFDSEEAAIDWINSMIMYYPEPGVDLWEVKISDPAQLKQDVISKETYYSVLDIPPSQIDYIRQFLENDVVDLHEEAEEDLPHKIKDNAFEVAEYLKHGNILDPVQNTLDQDVFNGMIPKEDFFDYHLDHIKEVFRQHGFNKHAFDFYLTGSLCTYQYSETSDVDISIVCNLDYFSEEDRADLISIVVNSLDGTYFPRTLHKYQHFVQPFGIDIYDLFSLGTRAAWDFQRRDWVVKPSKSKVHDISKEKPDWISTGIQFSDKINSLIDAGKEEEAKSLYQTAHERRKEDQKKYGDYSEGNIIYKLLDNNGTFDRLRNIGQRIA